MFVARLAHVEAIDVKRLTDRFRESLGVLDGHRPAATFIQLASARAGMDVTVFHSAASTSTGCTTCIHCASRYVAVTSWRTLSANSSHWPRDGANASSAPLSVFVRSVQPRRLT